MRILHVITAMGRGGAEIQVRDLVEAMVKRGHAVSVVVLLPIEEFEDELRQAGAEVLSLQMTRGYPTPRALFRLVSHVRSWRPDVIHAHMFAAIVLARTVVGTLSLRAPLAKRPTLVCTAHARYERSRLRYATYRATHRLGDLWTNVSTEGVRVHEAHGALPQGTGVQIPNGIDVARFAAGLCNRDLARHTLDLDRQFVWLSIGSFRNEDKDYGTMLRAFVDVRSEAPDTLLLIAGAGPLLDEKKALARSLGLANAVRFLGLRRDIPTLLAAADAYVLSSQSEAMPIVLLEAAASSLPAVATDVGESRVIIDPPRGGRVAAARDPHALGRVMLEVQTLPHDERARMVAHAHDRVARMFDLDAIVTRWLQIYERLARRDSSSAHDRMSSAN